MTLKAHLIAQIAENGPLNLASFMHECLLHPTLGYYSTKPPFGAEGDFITAPDISQMFGEMIGLCLAQSWQDQGSPARFTLAELGPGRGTLMADILNATKIVPGFQDAACITLIEASARLRDIQKRTLAAHNVTFAQTVDSLPKQPLFFVANEFFDALPIRQFQRSDKHWRERQVGLLDGQLVFGLGLDMPQPALKDRLKDTRAGDVVEYAPAAAPIMETLSARITEHGGAGLIIDYGDWRSLGDTFQALQNHRTVNPLADPGSADLTAHVDFETLSRAVGCKTTRLSTQGVFLERLGITARAQSLSRKLGGAALDNHVTAHRRLTHPDEMGNLFKVLGLFPAHTAPPPGLEI